MKKNLADCRKENLVLHAVLLLRTVNKHVSKEKDIELYRELSKEELVEYIEHFHDPQPEITFEERADWDLEFENHYSPSCTHGDYSPSCPWNAPGMSVSDFI